MGAARHLPGHLRGPRQDPRLRAGHLGHHAPRLPAEPEAEPPQASSGGAVRPISGSMYSSTVVGLGRWPSVPQQAMHSASSASSVPALRAQGSHDLPGAAVAHVPAVKDACDPQVLRRAARLVHAAQDARRCAGAGRLRTPPPPLTGPLSETGQPPLLRLSELPRLVEGRGLVGFGHEANCNDLRSSCGAPRPKRKVRAGLGR